MVYIFGQDGGHPPSWICRTHFRTTHEEFLEVFITGQNLLGLGIAAGVLVPVICKFEYFARFTWKRLFQTKKSTFTPNIFYQSPRTKRTSWGIYKAAIIYYVMWLNFKQLSNLNKFIISEIVTVQRTHQAILIAWALYLTAHAQA